MIFVKDAKDLRFIRFNKAGEDLFGYSREELIGKNDYDFFPEEADFFTTKDHEVLETQKFVEIAREPILTKNREVRILHTKKITFSDQDSKPQYLLGISEDIQPRIFEPFFSTKDNRQQANLGLGLSVSRSLVQAMGGELEFETRQGQGTVFFARFPLP